MISRSSLKVVPRPVFLALRSYDFDMIQVFTLCKIAKPEDDP
jgi:hypothetical protein